MVRPIELSLRPATLSDLHVIREIRREAILGICSAEFSSEELQVWAGRRSLEYFAPLVREGLVVIAEADGVPVAWGSSAEDKIEGVYVHPSAGRSGVGRTLVAYLEAEISGRGYGVARLAASLNASSFYEQLGYRKTRSYSVGQAFQMQRELQSQ